MAGERVLVVEDDANIAQLILAYLGRGGYEARGVPDGEAALAALDDFAPDIVVLDLMLPRLDGWEVCRRIRGRDGPLGRLPVIMLTAKGEEFDRVLGLELGADDYVTKPFSPRELVARVRAVLRRAPVAGDAPADDAAGGGDGLGTAAPTGGDDPVQALSFPDFAINLTSRELSVGGERVACPAKEFDLLWLLSNNPERVFGREALLAKVWGYEYYGDARTVDVHIRRVRQKIEPDPHTPRYIETVWGVGYKFTLRNVRGA